VEYAKNPSTPHRLPPQNLEAEQCVLGSIMLQPGTMAKAAELLTENDFYRDAHKLIYSAMVNLFEKVNPSIW
jgi:replicative DNA helicase